MRKIFVVALLILCVMAVIGLVFNVAHSEDLEEGWILCQPDSSVNVRLHPKTSAEITGNLFLGDLVLLDGRQKNGYLHCNGISNEYGGGWVYKGYITDSKPVSYEHEYLIESDGRVAARRYIGGTRRCWVNNLDTVFVYVGNSEWCLTNKGFIKTNYIDLTCPMDVEKPDPSLMTWEEDDDA